MTETRQLKAISSKPQNTVTSYDVAKLAGVSQSAVSRCFRDGASISNKMRSRVLKAAEELGYQPNAIARSLITRRSNIVAILISNLTNINFPEVLAEFSKNLRKNGFRILLFAVNDETEIDDALDNIWPYRVDGIIAAVDISPQQMDEINGRDTPVVCYNRNIPGITSNTVSCDQEDGARQLVDGLFQAGHRSYVFLSGPPGSVVGAERETATLERLDELGIEDVRVIEGDFSYKSGFDGVVAMLDSVQTHPDALLCANDTMAIGAIDALRGKFGYEIPSDISVVGFDGISAAAWQGYQITTIRQPIVRMAQAVVSILVAQIEQPGTMNERRIFSGILRQGVSAKFETNA